MANIVLFWILRFVYSPDIATLVDLSIAARQRGEKLIPNKKGLPFGKPI